MIRFYIDEDASRKSFIEALKKNKIDVLSTPDAQNRGLVFDLEQLACSPTKNNLNKVRRHVIHS